MTALWGESPSDGAATTLRTHVGAVRRVLASAGARETLGTRAGGYLLALTPTDLDAEVFAGLVDRGQEALGIGDPARAAALLGEALALWRGDVLSDLGPPAFAGATVARLDELRVVGGGERHRRRSRPRTAPRGGGTAAGARRGPPVPREAVRAADAGPVPLGSAGRCACRCTPRPSSASATSWASIPAPTSRRSRRPSSARTRLCCCPWAPPPLPRMSAPDRPRLGHPPPAAARCGVRGAPAVRPGRPHDRARDDQGDLAGDPRRRPGAGRRERAAGVGKSRLAAELAHLATLDGATVLIGRCDAAVPYAAWPRPSPAAPPPGSSPPARLPAYEPGCTRCSPSSPRLT